MKYSFYPGCSQESGEEQFGKSSEAVCRALGIELEEIPDWTCCGASAGHFLNEELAHALPGRNLAIAEKAGNDVACVCAACYLRLRHTMHEVRNSPEFKEHLEKLLGMPYEAKNEVRHLLDILVNDLGLEAVENEVKKPLKGLNLVCFYGCYLMRPPEIVAFDDPENPTIMDKLISTLGAEVLDWGAKVDCCGASLTLTKPDVVETLVGNIAQSARDVGADAIVVACPMCSMNLEMKQSGSDKVPVVYFTELMALALGLSDAKGWINKHVVSASKALSAHGL
jgi:heterodisulfide reductase subunit B